MHLPTLFTSLTMLAVTTAVPMASPSPAPTPTSAMPSFASPSHSVSASASPSASPNPFEAWSCPVGMYKNCCMGLEQTSHDILTPLGEIVPTVGGLQVSSAIAYQCKPMADKEPPNSCSGHGRSALCCDSKDNGLISACKPFEKVKMNYYSHKMQMPETQADIIMDAVT
ncbi:hypothetical protein PENANT_c004G04569 [Penicillium antarcticum]|uniref:Hydrophobin n=1 Tax=Penicillium antarcticum TaxID=416450 RepID=A0A1V6QH06_9EURO|nr:uncharacterized protein N7508_002525 [Penicillium antarcticum]KAJ5318017.1 hypothetical protein N7508_002525 [Penicillium antarcticum]OQD88282.1 hypothetical protein PENANT_c004G04569 [Penicillium antarcticum]